MTTTVFPLAEAARVKTGVDGETAPAGREALTRIAVPYAVTTAIRTPTTTMVRVWADILPS
jgi:hypothetical protein